jgi:hypothetical protein
VVYRLSPHVHAFAYRCGGSTGYFLKLTKNPCFPFNFGKLLLPRAPKNSLSIYNRNMSELTNISYNRLQDTLARLEGKTKALLDAVEQTRKERLSLESKIEDAQGRIQQILSKLPPQTDNGQMDLLAANRQDAE